MNGENFEASIRKGEPIRAYNVGCMLPHMDYEPRTLIEIARDSYILIANVYDSFKVYVKGNDKKVKIDYIGGDKEHDILYMDVQDGSVDHEIDDWRYFKDILQPWYREMRPALMEIFETQNIKELPTWR